MTNLVWSRRTFLSAAGSAVATVAVAPHYAFAIEPAALPSRGMFDDVVNTMTRLTGISREVMFSPDRSQSVVDARQHLMFAYWCLSSRSLPEIGRRCGGRDGVTVLYAVRKLESRIIENEQSRAWMHIVLGRCISEIERNGHAPRPRTCGHSSYTSLKKIISRDRIQHAVQTIRASHMRRMYERSI